MSSSIRRNILLMEMFYLKKILLENRIDFLRNKFIRLIIDHLERLDSSRIPQAIKASFPPDPPDMDIEDAFENDAVNLFNYVLEQDPDPVKKNSQWLLNLITRKNGKMPLEDLMYARETLQKFEEMKKNRQLPQGKTDINAYKSLADVEAIIRGETQAIVQAQDAEMQKALDESRVVLNNGDAMVIIPETLFSGMYWSRPSTWCTGWGDRKGRMPQRTDNHFEHYKSMGPLYVIHIKPTNEWYQFHEQTRQFNDSENRNLQHDPAALAKILKAHPDVVKAIGEEKLANAFFKTLGISFWSSSALEKMDPMVLLESCKTQEDFLSLPERVQHNSNIIAAFIIYEFKVAAKIIPHEFITQGVIEILQNESPHSVSAQSAFSEFAIPMKDWPWQAIEYAVKKGKLTYEQYIQIPEERQSNGLLHSLLTHTAMNNPELIKTYPPGFLQDYPYLDKLIKENPIVLQYLSPIDVTEDDLVKLAQDLNIKDFAYISPERLTSKVMQSFAEAHNEFDHQSDFIENPEKYIQRRWAYQAYQSLQQVQSYRDKNWEILKTLPNQYKRNTSFFEEVLKIICGDDRNVLNSDSLIKTFFNHVPTHFTSEMLEIAAKGIKNPEVRSWRHFFLDFSRDLWSPKFINIALTRGLISPTDIPEDKITPEVAGKLFEIDPARADMARIADDESLANAIKKSNYGKSLVTKIPHDRITEPIAFAAVSHSHVEDAKKLFPKKALSKRVYFAGVPYTFKLKDVPKSMRDDEMTLRAVSRVPSELKYVPEPLSWLNAHHAELSKNDKTDINWNRSLEAIGFANTLAGFQKITDLPHDEIKDGFTLFKSIAPNKTQRWFLRKDDKTVATLSINKGKLSLDNENPSKDLSAALRDVAERFLKNVNDISILNKVGIYKNADGSIRDEKDRKDLDTKTIEGLEWTISPHLKGKLHTAWKGDTALLKVYVAQAHGWGGGQTKIMKVDILDKKTAMKDAKAIIEGLKKICWGNPGNGLWELRNIGIDWSQKTGYWLATDRQVGKVGGYTVFYNSNHRYISIYGKQGLVALGTLLKSGELAKDHVFDWKLNSEKDADSNIVRKTLSAISKTISAKADTK